MLREGQWHRDLWSGNTDVRNLAGGLGGRPAAPKFKQLMSHRRPAQRGGVQQLLQEVGGGEDLGQPSEGAGKTDGHRLGQVGQGD